MPRRFMLPFGCTAWVALLAISSPPVFANELDPSLQQAALSWLADPVQPLPAAISDAPKLTAQQAESVAQQLWQQFKRGKSNEARALPVPTQIGPSKRLRLTPSELKTGDKTMPFVFLQRGQSDKPMPLFIALHGGGGAPVDGPHAWPVNTREWQTQARLAATIYPDNALYFVPRMADDRDGRWYYNYCQDAYDQVIREAIRYHNVDPNRVYLIGISEGAYTAYRLGAFMADRWAGAGSMAGGEPLRNAPPVNMRNLAFRADIGEHDTMFDRLGLNQRYGAALAEFEQDDPDGFKHMIQVHAGRGHGIDYRGCPAWIFQYSRDPWPNRIRWVNIDVHGRRQLNCYWLSLDAAPEGRLEIDASIDKDSNTVSVNLSRREGEQAFADDPVSFRIYLNDDLVNLDQPVRVIKNGTEVANGVVQRRLSTIMQSMVDRGDPAYSFPAVINVTN